jgi:hypothetical protein
MKVSNHNYIKDLKFHSGIHCDDYLISQGIELTIIPIK